MDNLETLEDDTTLESDVPPEIGDTRHARVFCSVEAFKFRDFNELRLETGADFEDKGFVGDEVCTSSDFKTGVAFETNAEFDARTGLEAGAALETNEGFEAEAGF